MCDKELSFISSFRRSTLSDVDLKVIAEYLTNINQCELSEKYIDGYVPVDGIITTLKADSLLLLSELLNISIDKIVNALRMNLSIVQAIHLNTGATVDVNTDTLDSTGGFSHSIKGVATYFDNDTDFINYLCKIMKLKDIKTYIKKFRYFIAMGCSLKEARDQIYEYIIERSGKWIRINNTEFGGTVWLSSVQATKMTNKLTTKLNNALDRYLVEFESYVEHIRKNKVYSKELRYIKLGFSEYYKRICTVYNIPYNNVLYATDKDLCDALEIRYSQFKEDMITYGDVCTCVEKALTRKERKINGE